MRSGDHLPRGGLRHTYTHALVSVADEETEEIARDHRCGVVRKRAEWYPLLRTRYHFFSGNLCTEFCAVLFLCVGPFFYRITLCLQCSFVSLFVLIFF